MLLAGAMEREGTDQNHIKTMEWMVVHYQLAKRMAAHWDMKLLDIILGLWHKYLLVLFHLDYGTSQDSLWNL